jgi:hypothetical protein
VSVFVILEAVFRLLDPLILLCVLLAKKRVLSEKSKILLGGGLIDQRNGSPGSNDPAIRQARKARSTGVRPAFP